MPWVWRREWVDGPDDGDTIFCVGEKRVDAEAFTDLLAECFRGFKHPKDGLRRGQPYVKCMLSVRAGLRPSGSNRGCSLPAVMHALRGPRS